MPRRTRPLHLRLHVEELESRTLLAADLFAAAATPFEITPLSDAQNGAALVSALLAPDSKIQLVSDSITYQGAPRQAGTYQGLDFTDPVSSQHLKILDGILLTTGDASSVSGNDGPGEGADLGTDGVEELATLVGGAPTFDGNSLSFRFTTPNDAKSIQFQLIFGSEEFPVYVASFNDVMGVYLDGKQIAFDNSAHPLTVTNNFFTLNNTDPSDTTNPNTAGKTVVDLHQLEYNGLTPTLFTTAPLDPNVTVHTIKFAIADTSDHVLDSGVFLAGLKALTTTSEGPTTGEEPPDDTPTQEPTSPGLDPSVLFGAQFGSVVGIVGTPVLPPAGFPTMVFPVIGNSAFLPGSELFVPAMGLPIGSGGDIVRGPLDVAALDDDPAGMVVEPMLPEAPPNFNMRHSEGELAGWAAEDPDLYLMTDDGEGFVLQTVALEQAFDRGRKLVMFVVDDEPTLLVETSSKSRRLAVDEGDEEVRRATVENPAIGSGTPGQSANSSPTDGLITYSWTQIGTGACILAGATGLALWRYFRRPRSTDPKKPTSVVVNN